MERVKPVIVPHREYDPDCDCNRCLQLIILRDDVERDHPGISAEQCDRFAQQRYLLVTNQAIEYELWTSDQWNQGLQLSSIQ